MKRVKERKRERESRINRDLLLFLLHESQEWSRRVSYSFTVSTPRRFEGNDDFLSISYRGHGERANNYRAPVVVSIFCRREKGTPISAGYIYIYISSSRTGRCRVAVRVSSSSRANLVAAPRFIGVASLIRVIFFEFGARGEVARRRGRSGKEDLKVQLAVLRPSRGKWCLKEILADSLALQK